MKRSLIEYDRQETTYQSFIQLLLFYPDGTYIRIKANKVSLGALLPSLNKKDSEDRYFSVSEDNINVTFLF